MATERINLDFNGKYSLGASFRQMDADIKGAQKSLKDFAGGGKNVLSELSSAFGDQLGGAVSRTAGLLTEITRGGIWGAMSAVATQAIGFMVEKWKEAKEKAKAYADVLRAEVVATVADLGVKVASLSQEMQKAEKDADALLKALNGKVDAAVKQNVANLNLEAVKQVAAGLVDAGDKAVTAIKNLKIGVEQANGELQKATNAQQVYTDELNALRQQAEELAAKRDAAARAEIEYRERYKYQLEEGARLQAQANWSVEEMQQQIGVDLFQARKLHAGYLKAWQDYQEANKGIYDGLTSITGNIAKADAAVKTATDAVAAAEGRVTASGEALQVARTNLTTAEAALANEERVAAEIQAKKNRASEDLEIAEEETARQLEWQNRIYEVAKKARIESGELINRLNELMEEGCEDEEIRHELNQKFAEIMERRNKAEETNAAAAEKDAKEKKGGKSPGSGTYVKVDIAGIGKGVESALGWQGWQKKHRQDQRDVRNAKNEMKIDQAPMTRFLRGDMPKKQADVFMSYLKSKYTPDQIQALGKLAMNTEMLSKKEAKKQASDIQKIAETIKKALAIQ